MSGGQTSGSLLWETKYYRPDHLVPLLDVGLLFGKDYLFHERTTSTLAPSFACPSPGDSPPTSTPIRLNMLA